MKNKRINEILKSAFGELDGDLGHMTDAERTEHAKLQTVREGLSALKDVPECQLSSERLHSAILGQMTEAERREHEAQRVVFEGLNALKDMPECQLSNERLQNAILSNAVKPRRVNSWSVATAAVACFAIAMIALRGMGEPNENGTVVLNDLPSSTSGLGSDTASSILNNQTQMHTPPTSGAASPILEDTGTKEDETAPVASGEVGPEFHKGKSDFDMVISSPDFDRQSGMVVAGAPNETAVTADHESIVVVDPNSRTRNGAGKATEMDTYGDVVFGG